MDLEDEKRSVTEGALMATVGTDAARRDFYRAETEVIAGRRKRKNYTESYKKKVVEYLSELRQAGNRDIGGYLRAEGLYYTMVRKWEKKYQMSENKKIKAAVSNSSTSREKELEEKVKALEKELERTKKKLQKSEMIIDFQKKISLLLNPDQQEDQTDKEK